MNLPKYKIGDKLVARCGYTAEVESISIRKNGIQYYGGPAAIGIGMEEDVKPYQEPQKKKLYAYRNECGMIQFSESDFPKVKDRANDEILDRKPEYDIEYSE